MPFVAGSFASAIHTSKASSPGGTSAAYPPCSRSEARS